LPPQTRFAESFDAEPTPQIPRTFATTTNVRIEERNTERFFVDPSREPYEAERRESRLVQAFREFLVARDHQVTRQRIVRAGEAKPIFSDVVDSTANLLVEAKGTATRDAVRMAFGQLADYARFLDNPVRAILIPAEPCEDLRALGDS
jgi:hypothetical protein